MPECTAWCELTDSEWNIRQGGGMERLPKESGELGAIGKQRFGSESEIENSPCSRVNDRD